MRKPSVLFYSKFKKLQTKRDRDGVKALERGFKKLGFSTSRSFGVPPSQVSGLSDIVVTCGWNRHPAPSALGYYHLVLDCGYLGKRTEDVLSLGWSGLNNRALPVEPIENRGLPYFENCKPWDNTKNKTVVLLGQVPTDKALSGVVVDYQGWLKRVHSDLVARGFEVFYKPHPRRQTLKPNGLPDPQPGTLTALFNRVRPRFAVAYSSNALVELAVKGVYPVPWSPLAMTWGIRTPWDTMEPVNADRKEWLDFVASKQFTLEEMESGFALTYLLQGVQQ